MPPSDETDASATKQPPAEAPKTSASEAGPPDDTRPLLLSNDTLAPSRASAQAAPTLGTFEEPHSTPFLFVIFLVLIPAAFSFAWYFYKTQQARAAAAAAKAAAGALPKGARPVVAPTVLISIDGFRHDYVDRMRDGAPAAPTLRRLARAGVRATPGMTPVMPSKTFPNHWALATGLYAESHGVVGNVMYDPRTRRWFRPGDTRAEWWHGTPVWKTLSGTPRVAEFDNGTRVSLGATYATGAVFWVGSDVDGLEADAYWTYDRAVPYDRRVDRAVALLSGSAKDLASPAHFVALYLDGVDRAGHLHGPASDAVTAEIARADAAIARLLDGLGAHAEQKFNLVIVSDHGITDVSPQRAIELDDAFAPASVQDVVSTPLGMWLNASGPSDQVYAALAARATDGALSVFRKADMPERWHLAKSARVTDVVSLAKLGWTVKFPHAHIVPGARGVSRIAATQSVLSPDLEHKGQHGFDNAEADMQATFIAAGPAFREGATVKGLRVVDVYPMICHMFAAVAAPNNGSLQISKEFILRAR